MTAKREKIVLTDIEQKKFDNLPSTVGVAWQFWEDVCKARGLDFQTGLNEWGSVTALPVGHGEHWCYPYPLKAKHDGAELYRELRAKGEIA